MIFVLFLIDQESASEWIVELLQEVVVFFFIRERFLNIFDVIVILIVHGLKYLFSFKRLSFYRRCNYN